MIPAFYAISTPGIFGEGYLRYISPYILMNLLPELSYTLMGEKISHFSLCSRFHKNYTKNGYSIREFLLLGEIIVYVGFEFTKYKSLGARTILCLR